MHQQKKILILIAVLLIVLSSNVSAQISVLPHGFGITMDENDNADAELIIVNDYEEPVTYTIDYELIEEAEERRQGPGRDEPGDQLNQFQSPLNNIGGMAFDGELLWGSSHGSDRLCAMTLEGEQVRLIDINDNPLTMTFDGELLWVCQWSTNQIFQYDLEGEQVGQFNVGFEDIAGMGSDQENFVFMNSRDDGLIHVISIEDHEEVTRFEFRQAMGNADIWAIEWVESHREGRLWGNTRGHLYQASVDDEWNVEAVSDFAWNTDQPYNDPCHDGENMWHGMWDTNMWYVFDDGVAEFFMLTFDPEEGEVPGEDSAPVEVFINSEGIEPGDYNILIDLETDREIIQLTAIISVDSPAAFLTCRVTDAETEETMENIRIEMDRYDITRFTNRNGITDFESLPTGQYEFTFTAEDYLTLVEPYRIDGEGELFLAVELLHSECNPSRDNIEAALIQENSIQTEIVISNDGNGPLTYTTEKRLLGDANADPWELRRNINIGQITDDSRIQGVVFFDDLFYFSGANDAEPVIHVINRDGEQVDQYAQLGESRYGYKDLTWDGELIWGSGERTVFGFTPEGEEVESFNTGISPCNNLAWDCDREILWASGTTTDIFGFNREGDRVAQIPRQGIRIYGLAYWPDDPDGYQLYIFHKVRDVGDEVVTKVDIDNGEMRDVIILEPEGVGGAQGCFITNQYDIYSWVFMANVNDGGDDRTEIWQIDARKDWMDIEPEEGVIEAEEEREFVITLDATGLPPAQFVGEIVLNHDGIGSQTPIRITLDVGEGGGGGQEGEMILNFVDGWNIISAYVQPEPDDIVEIMSELVEADQLVLMKNGAGQFYNPEFNFCNIPGWRVNEGYMVNVTGDAEMSIAGQTVAEDDPLPLIEGWQIVSYYPRRGIDARVALSSIVDVLLLAKDAAGRFYNPEFDFSNMGDLQPGQGYLVNVREAVELIYNLDEELDFSAWDIYIQPRLLPIHPSTGENMSLLVLTNAEKGEIGVYANSDLVGSGVIQNGKCGIAVWGDDPTTTEVDGAVDGDVLELKYYSDDKFQSTQFETLIGRRQYKTDDFWVAEMSDVAILPDKFGIEPIHPNPFNSTTSISYSLPDAAQINLSLYDTNGRLVKEMISGFKYAGTHSLIVYGNEMTSGVYVVQLSNERDVCRRKIMLIK